MIKRVLKRSLFYYRNGSSLLTMPISFLGWASAIFYLAIDHIPALQQWFPNFTSFLIIGGAILVVTCTIFGYIYVKRSFFYPTDQQIQYEANPFAYKFGPGRDTEFQKATLLNAQFLDRIAKKWKLYETFNEEMVWRDYMDKLDFLIKGGDLRNYRKDADDKRT